MDKSDKDLFDQESKKIKNDSIVSIEIEKRKARHRNENNL